MIKLFYFIAQMGDWRRVVGRHIRAIEASGLYDAAGKIHVCLGGGLAEDPVLPPKYRICYRSELTQFEFSALHMVKHYTEPGDQVLYLHTKGVSKPAGRHRETARNWCDYMTWGVVEHWREMVAAIAEHDVAGVQWTNLDPRYQKLCGVPACFAGNFWWARGDWIDGLLECEFSTNRYRAEGWVAAGKPRIFDYHNLTRQAPVTATNGPSAPGFSRAAYTSDPDPAPGVDEIPVRPAPKPRARPTPRPAAAAPTAPRAAGPRSRHEIINALISARGYRSYLEIGVFQFACFNQVRCEIKHCVDPGVPRATFPLTSDAFFALPASAGGPLPTYDIVFIDGLHTEAQVLVDVRNAIARLSPGGTIVCHDCNPETIWEQRDIPEYDNQGVWLGTVWLAWARLRMTRPDLSMRVIDTDFGVGVIQRGRQALYVPPPCALDYRLLARDRRRLLNLIDPAEFCA